MQISRINDTCSMGELGDVSWERLEKLSKKEFFDWIEKELEEEDINAKTLIYNTTFNSDIREQLESKYGFKEVHSYYGNEDSMVYVMMLNLV